MLADAGFWLCLLAFAGVVVGCLWACWDVLSPYGPERYTREMTGRGED